MFEKELAFKPDSKYNNIKENGNYHVKLWYSPSLFYLYCYMNNIIIPKQYVNIIYLKCNIRNNLDFIALKIKTLQFKRLIIHVAGIKDANYLLSMLQNQSVEIVYKNIRNNNAKIYIIPHDIKFNTIKADIVIDSGFYINNNGYKTRIPQILANLRSYGATKVYRIYTRNTFREFNVSADEEIMLKETLLCLKHKIDHNLMQISNETYYNSLVILNRLKLIENDEVSLMGSRIADLDMIVEEGVLLYNSILYNCYREMLSYVKFGKNYIRGLLPIETKSARDVIIETLYYKIAKYDNNNYIYLSTNKITKRTPYQSKYMLIYNNISVSLNMKDIECIIPDKFNFKNIIDKNAANDKSLLKLNLKSKLSDDFIL